MFDFAKNDPAVEAESGFEFEVLLPSGVKTGAFIKVRGEHSPVVKNYNRKFLKELSVREKQVKKSGRNSDFEPEELEEMQAKTAASRIISWKGISENSEEVKYSQVEAERLMLKYPWIAEQVVEVSKTIDNFRSGTD